MLLAVFKNGGTWDVLAALFQLSSSTFERLICGFLMKVYPHMYELFVKDEANSLSMTRLVAMGRTFKSFPCALYAVDATFQQSNRPLGPHNEALYAFSGKYHWYGKKVEVSVSPLGFAINVSDNVLGSIHDKTMFDNNRDFHMKMRAKRPNDYNLLDEGPLRTEYPDEWALLADKGYQGAQNTCRSIIPTRATQSNRMSLQIEQTNERISSDRIIVEKWFGRHCTLWAICSEKFKWSNSLYDPIFKACASLTNYQIWLSPLRDEDGHEYRRILNRLKFIQDDMKMKKRLAQEAYVARCKARRRMELFNSQNTP
ncbi:hypothetical protein LEN26_018454 [Aphanomyces euteiches]|nr:hypothetical protein LEN26_018454 [Aphanomyces euteiches]